MAQIPKENDEQGDSFIQLLEKIKEASIFKEETESDYWKGIDDTVEYLLSLDDDELEKELKGYGIEFSACPERKKLSTKIKNFFKKLL